MIRKPVIKVVVDPNLVKLVEIPVAVVGEVSGTVLIKNENGENGLARMIINIHDSEGVFIAKVLSESDGFFTYVGLSPGQYVASIDAAQLKKLNMKVSSSTGFTISANPEGDIVEGLKFLLDKN